ncbi:kelch domain-containing protein, putative [Plasmodium vinckei]|uniref:Kelch domain-containing protein, putative n=1 Tax=Plasmodium vinckei TaxID=5860 RepID=A0A6V7SM83_PLAVN|nr:kelch domain-containing protein, putative [Plasmodium vinckei]
MNIINYLYSKSKNIYNRNINAYNYNNIENEKLISHFSDTNNNYSNNSYSSKSSSHNLAVSNRNFDRYVKNKNIKKDYEHGEDGQEEYNEKRETMASYLNKSGNIKDLKKKNMINSNSNFYIRNSNTSNGSNSNKILQHNSGIGMMNSNIDNSKLCYEFNIYNIGFDKKVYKNRCDGVCVLNDNIYIFDKIKKCIYLYTPYNNVWYIFLDIYEEISIKKNNTDIPNMYDMENEKQYIQHKYVNNISFLNYADMVYLNDYLFIISSNSQFMNICKVNINNMNTLFGAIVICSYEKNNSTNSDVNNNEKQKNEQIREFSKNNKHANSLVSKTDVDGNYKLELNRYGHNMENDKNENIDYYEKVYSDEEKEKEERSDEYIYVNGISKFDEFFDDEKNENSKKYIIKARDYFSLCSVNEKSCSSIYLFGGKGNTIKEKNEYIDIIYNDLYVYDFYMNKWTELHECKSDNIDDQSEINEKYYEHVHVENSNSHDHVNNNCENFINSKEEHKLYDFNAECYESFIPSEKKNIGKEGTNSEADKFNLFFPLDENSENVNKIDKPSVCDKNSNKVNSPIITTIKEQSPIKNVEVNKNGHQIDEQLFTGLEISNSVSKKKKNIENTVEECNKNNSNQSNNKDNLYNLIFDSISMLNDEKNICCLGASSNADPGSLLGSSNINEVPKEEVKNEDVKNEDMKNEVTKDDEQVKGNCINCRKNEECKYICEMIKKNIKIKKLKWLGRRAGHTCNYYKNNLYIFGGINYYSFNKNKINLNFCNNLYLYNIETNKCFEIIGKGNIPEKRYRHSSIIINDYMFILGGECQNSTLPKNDLFFYNFENSVWSEIIINSTIGSHALYKSIWLENFGSIYMFGSSILRLTKKNFQYTPSYKSHSDKIKNNKDKIVKRKK